MSSPGKVQILKLYKDLLRYGKQLKLTDKEYFNRRIRKEFKTNRALEDPIDINFNFKKGVSLLLRRSVE